MRRTYQKTKLGDVCLSVKRGISPKYVQNDGILIINQKCVRNGALSFAESRLTSRNTKISKDKLVMNGDVLINSTGTGTLGRSAPFVEKQYSKQLTADSHVTIARPDLNKVNPIYLAYQIRVLESVIINMAKGATNQIELSPVELKELELFIPYRNTQDKIADILVAYDSFININRRRIQFLEEAVRLLYREWFVYFRFPENEKTKKVEGVPEGWRKGSLEDITTIKKGRNITFEQAIEGNIPVVGGGLEPTYYHNKANVCAPVITISASGANAGYVNLYHSDVWASDCSYMNRETTKHIFYLFLMLKSLQAYLTGLQVGVAQPHVYPKDLNRSKVLIPSDDICERFELLVTPMFDLIKNLKHHNQNLAQARDFLLPRLMNGKIDVSEIDIEVAQEAEA